MAKTYDHSGSELDTPGHLQQSTQGLHSQMLPLKTTCHYWALGPESSSPASCQNGAMSSATVAASILIFALSHVVTHSAMCWPARCF